MLLTRCLGIAMALCLAGACATRTGTGGAPKPARGEILDARAAILLAEDRRETDEAFRAALTHRRPALRAEAALALGRIASGDAREVLASMLDDDTDDEVRAAAAFALGLLGDPAGHDALSRAVIDPSPDVRASVAEALGRLGLEECAQSLDVLLRDDETAVRAAASLAVARLPDPAFAISLLIENSEAGDLATTFASTYALARMSSSGTATASRSTAPRVAGAERQRIRSRLVALAGHESAEVRMQVARGLAFPSGDAESRTLATLLRDPDARVRIQVVTSLSYPDAPVEPLAHAARDRHPQVVAAAYAALGVGRQPEARSLLLDGIGRHRPDWVRAVAIRSLGPVDLGSMLSLAPRFMLERNPIIGEAAIQSLAAVDDPRAVAIFRQALDSREPRIQAAGVLALGLRDGPVADRIGEALESPHPEVRAAAARVVGNRLASIATTDDQRDDLVGILEELWSRAADDASGVARRAVLDAAGLAEAPSEVRHLFDQGLDDPDRRVRARAVVHLRELYGVDARSRLHAVEGDPAAYRRIAEWSAAPRAAVVTIRREGYAPGRFTFALNVDGAPLTAWRFARMAADGLYDDLPFERLVPGFVLQTADALETGGDDPGGVMRVESGRLGFAAGTLGLAAEGTDSFGTQWFVTLSAQPHLDGRFTALGRVAQNFPGVVLLAEPGDRIVSVEVYEGDGSEPLGDLDESRPDEAD